MSRFGKLFLVVVLAYAWTWTGLLKDLGLITNLQRLLVLAVTTILFVGQQIMEIYGTAANASDVAARRDVIEAFLSELLNTYYQANRRGGAAGGEQ